MGGSGLLFYGFFTGGQVARYVVDHSDQVLGCYTYTLRKESIDLSTQKQNQGEIVKEDEHNK
jgi:hypothetical protein